MNKNVERGQATRAHLIDVAMRLFTERGYDGTSIETVLAEAEVSRGSLYHHFPGKEALFMAVLEAVGARIGAETIAAIEGTPDPIELLRIGCRAWIRQARDPVVRQIMLIDGPAVLGWQRWRELDEVSTLGAIKSSVGYAADTGAIERRYVDVFAHLVLAAVNEVAMMIAVGNEPDDVLSAAESAVEDFLDRLLGNRQGR